MWEGAFSKVLALQVTNVIAYEASHFEKKCHYELWCGPSITLAENYSSWQGKWRHFSRRWLFNANMSLVKRWRNFVVLLPINLSAYARVLRSFSRVWVFVTLWTAAHQAPLSMGFPREGYWSGLPFPSPGVLPNSGIKPWSPALLAYSLLTESPEKPQ